MTTEEKIKAIAALDAEKDRLAAVRERYKALHANQKVLGISLRMEKFMTVEIGEEQELASVFLPMTDADREYVAKRLADVTTELDKQHAELMAKAEAIIKS